MNDRELLDLIGKARDEEWQSLDLSGLGLDLLPPESGNQLTHILKTICG